MKYLAFLLVLIWAPMAAEAQTNFLIADDSSTGMYSAMLQELGDICKAADGITIVNKEFGNGAIGNLTALDTNQVSAAFMHADVIYAASLADNKYKNYKTLAVLYPEEIHVFALRNSLTVDKASWVRSKKSFDSLSDGVGYKVGAAGGGVVTANMLRTTGQGGFEVVQFDKGDEVFNALKSGQVDFAVFVGGYPIPAVQKLDGNTFKMVPIGDRISSNMGGLTSIYRPATLNYQNLKSGTVKTLAPIAIIATRAYTIPRLTQAQAAFRDCFYKGLDELKETPGKHPKWSTIDPKERGIWDWYEIPAAPKAVPVKK